MSLEKYQWNTCTWACSNLFQLPVSWHIDHICHSLSNSIGGFMCSCYTVDRNVFVCLGNFQGIWSSGLTSIFFVKIGRSASKIWALLKRLYGEQCYERVKCFSYSPGSSRKDEKMCMMTKKVSRPKHKNKYKYSFGNEERVTRICGLMSGFFTMTINLCMMF